MIFQCHHQTYNTQDMLTIRTGYREMPFLFMTNDHGHAFFFVKDADGSMFPRAATEDELEHLAEVLGLPELMHLPDSEHHA